jgi:hypothetical protein
MRGIRLITLSAVMLLAGCAPITGAEPTPSEPPSERATPTPSPTIEPALTSIRIGPLSVVAADQNGDVLGEFTYDTPAPMVVEAFTEWFGFEPTPHEIRRGEATDAFAGTVYDWEGFTIAWRGGWDDDPTSGRDAKPELLLISASSSASTVRDVSIATIDRIAVGQDAIDLEAQHPDSSERLINHDGAEILRIWTACVAIDLEGYLDPQDCVISTSRPIGEISSISAPYALNHGI